MYLRFANALFEPIWNREHVESIQITMAEDFGVEERGQVLRPGRRDPRRRPEPPAAGARARRDGAAVGRPRRDSAAARGRLPRDAGGRSAATRFAVSTSATGTSRASSPGSDTETFVALRLEIENWRWAGVPILVRAGKALPATATEIVIRLQRVPQLQWGGHRLVLARATTTSCCASGATRVSRSTSARRPRARRSRSPSRSTSTSRRSSASRRSRTSGCSRTRCAATRTLFPRWSVIEETWRIVQPLLDDAAAGRACTSRGRGGRRRRTPRGSARRLARAAVAVARLARLRRDELGRVGRHGRGRAVDLRVGLLAARRAARRAVERRARASSTSTSATATSSPRSRSGPIVARLDLAARARMGRAARLPPHGRASRSGTSRRSRRRAATA